MPSSTLPTPHAIVRSSMPLPGQPETDLTSSLDHARRDLLDLGLRNTLLNFRPLRAKGVEVIDELPVEVFRLLVREERRLTFLPGQNDGTASDYYLALPQPEDEPGAA